MQFVLSVIMLIFWLVIAPFLIGVLCNFILPKDRRTPGITFILGFLVYMAGFEVIAIPCMTNIVYGAFNYCTRYFLILSSVLIIGGLVRFIYFVFVKKEMGEILTFNLIKPNGDGRLKLYYYIFFALVLFQMVMSVVMASFDGDDAYYVVESLLAQQAEVMNTILPYTGISTSLDIRHALAVITMWIAFIARMSGLHATIVSHSIIGLLIIPLVYLVYTEIAKTLLKGKRELVPVFMIIISFLMMFGNVSIYTPATFFLTRTWQGKAIVANLVFPLIFLVFFWMMEEDYGKGSGKDEPGNNKFLSCYGWIMLTLVNMLSGMCTSMGVIFGSGLIALLTLVLMFVKKKLTPVIEAFICVIPNFIYLALYFSIWSN